MRFNEFEPSIEESAADELKRKLPSLRKTDYDTIDRLMQRISKRYRISGDKLHDIFVKKYKHTPDHWIKKYREKLGEVETPNSELQQEVDKFVAWSSKRLGLKTNPKVELSMDTEEAQNGHHTGRHIDGSNKVWVYVNNRNLVDILRTVFHELVHVRQGELNMIQPGDSYPGSPIEAMADVLAGKWIKIYSEQNRHIFQ